MAETLLYYITDRKAFADDEPKRRRRLLEKIEEATRAGVAFIQLREKDLPARDLELLAIDAGNVVAQTPTKLFINSRLDIAMAVGANIHLRSDDISPREARAIWSLDRRQELAIAVSCHTLPEVARASEMQANFAVFGPVFEKKDNPNGEIAGIETLRHACELNIPVLALGGITSENAHACIEAGAAGIAAIRLFQENDIPSVVNRVRLG